MNTKNEEWRDIADCEGNYMVSDLGRVKSVDRFVFNGGGFILGGILALRKDDNGYLQVGLNQNGKLQKASVHRLVAEAFIPNPDGKPNVGHIDGNKQNNAVENLEWID